MSITKKKKNNFLPSVDIKVPHGYYHPRFCASVAQLVEHSHGKAGVIGSSPIGGSFPSRNPLVRGTFCKGVSNGEVQKRCS